MDRPYLDNSVQNSVFVRAKLLKDADHFYNNGMESESVHCQAEALCIGFRKEFKSVLKQPKFSTLLDQMNNDIGDCEIKSNGDLIGKIKDELLPNFNLLLPECPRIERKVTTTSTQQWLRECHKLPAEWTVLQLTKQFDANACDKLATELLTTNGSIYISLLKYPRMALNGNKPITVLVSPKNDDLFRQNERIAHLIKDSMKIKDLPVYAESLADIDRNISQVLDHMYSWLGAYIALFVGEFKDAAMVALERGLFDQVDSFVEREQINDPRTTVLLSIICRALDLLNVDDLEAVAVDLSKDATVSHRISEFLLNLKGTSRLSYRSASYPVILIVDELLDNFYWEMLLPDKEMSRCSALYLLMEIYNRFKDKISNGYIRLNIKRGTALINLGDDLPRMQKRMTAFFEYWKPTWRQFVKATPTPAEISDLMRNSNAIVYAGHGNGKQFLDPENSHELNGDCVVFLFGCESVNLKSYGSSSERVGVHLYYHSILCPLIVGALTIVTDGITDQICVLTLSTWLKADAKREKHPQYIDRKRFKEGVFECASIKLYKEFVAENDPNLLRIFTQIRQVSSMALWMRAAFVVRGLPVYNCN